MGAVLTTLTTQNRRIVPRIRDAGFLSAAFLKVFGFAAVVSPWRTIYVLPEFTDDEAIYRHEVAHLTQMDRDGWLTFWARCLWWYISPGYERSPYEIEARQAETDPRHALLRGYEWSSRNAD
mgnify:CR=1 FL=1